LDDSQIEVQLAKAAEFLSSATCRPAPRPMPSPLQTGYQGASHGRKSAGLWRWTFTCYYWQN